MADNQQQEEPLVVPFFRKRTSKNVRKRERSADPAEGEDPAADDVVRKKKDDKRGPLTSVSKPRSATLQTPTSSNLTEDQRRLVTFAASGTAASIVQDTATRTLDVDGADDNKDDSEVGKVLAGDEAEVYQGIHGYKEYVNKKTEKTTQSNANHYQMDVCKDYKETGTCTFGDSCIFMHDRTDYKTGWQLDREWEDAQKKKQQEEMNKFMEVQEEEIEEDDDLPFACLICRKDFKDPVVTKCKHYFCESCALKHHSKSGKCFTCGAATHGVFNGARDLKAKIEEKKKRMDEKAAAIKQKAGAELEGED
ncbi:hypothetical protein HDV05_003628 [Chytridiales sp. JEL 0842]|nr:hypothetical protein HDV05_003628 [Chytridiales sp. JEL 0842]